MTKYQEALKKLRPKSRKKLQGIMKVAQKKRKSGGKMNDRMSGKLKG